MGISTHYWLIAFVLALTLHALAGAAIWLADGTAPAPEQSPRGVMVSLDALSIGNSARIDSKTPVPVEPVEATTPEPATTTTPQPVATDSLPSSPVDTAAPSPVTPVTANTAPAATQGARLSAAGVDIPIAQAVTIKAADTLRAMEQTVPAHVATTTPDRFNTGSGTLGQSSDPTTTYINRITFWLSNHKYYPQAARKSGAEGTVRLHIVIGRNGNVINVGIAHSSGSAALDQAAMDMVKRSEPLPAMSDNMLRTRLEIILPVNYTLSIEPDAVVDTTK